MRYIIDGYNLIFQIYGEEDTIGVLRETFIEDLEEKASALQLHFIVVFDAHRHASPISRNHLKHIEIIYTEEGQTADEYIIELVRIATSPQKTIVVTSDKPLAAHVRAYFAKTESGKVFLSWLQKKARKKQLRQKKPPISTKILPAVTQAPKLLEAKDPLFAFYLESFEKMAEKEHLPKKAKRVPKESEMERWLRLFNRPRSD